MRQLLVTCVLVTVSVSLATALDSVAPHRDAAIAALSTDSGGAARVELDSVTGAARLVTLPPGALGLAGDTVAARSRDFLARYGAAFGVRDAANQLNAVRRPADPFGGSHVAYEQRHHGVEVFGGELRLHFDNAGSLVAANGTLVSDIRIRSTVPDLDGDEAASVALAAVAKQVDDWNLDAAALRLLVFRAGLVAGRPESDHLVWEVEVGNGRDVREFVYVDAHRGFPVDQITGIEHLRRTVYHENLGNLIWTEGDALPYEGLGSTRDSEVNGLIDFAEDTHQLFANLSGGSFLSYNGNDARMRTVYEDDNLSCPNAWWVGSYTGYCQGTASDDVVAHEWTHAYTDYTHDLVYQWQPGALNEAYSDIFGEVVDLINGAGTDTSDDLRTDDTCSALTGGAEPRLTVEQPPGLVGELAAGGAEFNPLPPWSAQGQLELVNDGDDRPHDGCQELIDFTPGRIALLEFRSCQFRTPVENAAAAGASAVVVINSINDSVIDMPGDGPRLNIPAVMVGESDGAALVAALDQGVSVSMESMADGSLRWVVAEDTLWSGLRDMWRPECVGDPGSVTSSRYWCSSGDNGGVHTNSGVPNHAFALAVDGGNFNQRTVRGIGLIKAAHVYWRAMSVYQTRISDFTDHADLIEQSCDDLVGEPLADLITGDVSGEVIDADDCVQLAEAMAAVEMRTPPNQCGFDTLLDPEAPDTPRYRSEIFFEAFDSAPSGWTVSNEGVDQEDWVPRDWIWTTDLPFGGDGGAFFATNDDMGGNCFSNNQSGALYLDGPPISIPDLGPALLVFEHYVATEPSADGGNLRISVNGGPWQLVPADNFEFNPYNDQLSTSGGSDNPYAGEPAFSGVNENSFRGSWGQSQVSLAGLVRSGDTVRFRFNFAVDGCAGYDGWYVDNVRLVMGDSVLRGGDRVIP